MALDNNPLKQYFRRPGIYLKLPSKGIGYTPDVLTLTENGELPVYPMTAIDEITSKTPDSLYNGSAVAEIVKSCVPNIKNPWLISSTDLDAILVAIRIATNGNDMDIETTCPACSEEAKYGVNLNIVLQNFVPGNYIEPTHIGELEIKFRPLNYKEITENAVKQFEIQKAIMSITSLPEGEEKEKKGNELLKIVAFTTLNIIASTIEHIKTPDASVEDTNFILDFLQNADKNVVDVIRNKSLALRETTQMKPLHMTCSSCSHEYDQLFTLNVSDFFA
jgi:hypothetical protein